MLIPASPPAISPTLDPVGHRTKNIDPSQKQAQSPAQIVDEPASTPEDQQRARPNDQKLHSYTPQELKIIDELKKRDREVRSHEAAHKAAAGSYAQGGPTFTYTTGPDGQRYIAAGEVAIDLSAIPHQPEATLAKARTLYAAALAPAEPSSQDRAVAAAAIRMAMEAQQQIQTKHPVAVAKENDANQSDHSSQAAALDQYQLVRESSLQNDQNTLHFSV